MRVGVSSTNSMEVSCDYIILKLEDIKKTDVHFLEVDKEISFNKVPFSLAINRQDGMNFSGIISTSTHKEVILGAIAPDFQGGVMTDEDGTHTFKIIDSTTIQNCYVQISKPRVAACWIGKKQQ